MTHPQRPGRLLAALTVALMLPSLSVLAQQAPQLRAYNVDPGQVSVSGLGSGANMAVQLSVAHSSRIKGVGVFSGVPYDCLRPGNVTSYYCSRGNQVPPIDILEASIRTWSGREIDDVAALSRQRVYAFVGRHDTTYGQTVVGETANLYRRFMPSSSVWLETGVDAPQTVPTDFDNPKTIGGTDPYNCSTSAAVPFATCGFDGAGAMLQWIYGPLVKRNEALPVTGYQRVDQSEFVSRPQGMDDVAWLYVPPACEAGAACKLHVFLHSCSQNYFLRGDTWVAQYSGHTRWAETNNIIVLFPQTYPDQFLNKEGCWDDDGKFGSQFDQKGGPQIEAIMAMVRRITDGFQGTTKAVEYHHAAFNHYFVTSIADEIASLDGGKFAGWTRTGEAIDVYPVGTIGTTDVCRFFSGEYYKPASSHFYTSNASECAGLMTSAVWQYEGLAFAIRAADAQGQCAGGEMPLFRLYNNSQGGVPNHRYTTSPSTRLTMTAAGWIPEGNGDLGVIGCSPRQPLQAIAAGAR